MCNGHVVVATTPSPCYHTCVVPHSHIPHLFWVWQLEFLLELWKHVAPRKHEIEDVEVLLASALHAHARLLQKVLGLHGPLDGTLLGEQNLHKLSKA